MSKAQSNREHIQQQIKVFSKWVSFHLSKDRTNVKVKDITKDLNNGVAVVELAEMLVGILAPRNWAVSPKRTEDMIHNNDLAIEMFTNDGVQFNGITGKDVYDNDEKLILDFVWILILYYSIGFSIQFDGDINDLMAWAIDRTSKYPNIEDFQPYHLSMCALLDSYHPDKINYSSLDPDDKEQNAKLAINVMRELKIPVILDANDLQSSEIDEKSLLAQLALLKVKLEKLPTKRPKTFKAIENVQIQSRSIEIDEEAQIQSRSIEIEPKIEEEEQNESQNVEIEEEEEEPEKNDDLEVNDILQFQTRSVPLDDAYCPYKVEGDNRQYSGKKFGLTMTLKKSDYNNGHKMNPENSYDENEEEIQLALALMKDDNPYLNPSGRMLDLVQPNIQNDPYQHFTFGKDEWSTIIDSFVRIGMVWDVCDRDNTNPPAGTPFYVFPFHGRHNQHFIYKDSMIYAQQNGHVVTYVGGDEPLVMMPPSDEMKNRQTFLIKLL